MAGALETYALIRETASCELGNMSRKISDSQDSTSRTGDLVLAFCNIKYLFLALMVLLLTRGGIFSRIVVFSMIETVRLDLCSIP